MSALLIAALAYAARGIPVYPVHWPRPTPGGASLACSCPRGPACDRPAKHPLVRHGIHDASCDPDRIGRWWRRWPHANLGLATGIIFDALDIDGPAGLAALHQLADAAGLRLPGPLVATGSGGWHHWFRPTGLGNRPTPRPAARRLARPRRRRARPTQPPHLRGQLPLAPRPRSGAAARGPGRPARPARPPPTNHDPANPHNRAEHAGPPVRPPGPGRRAGRPRPGHPRPRAATPSTAPRSRSTATSPAASSPTRT
jgi:Bifunctional DNA primase/polymerase, N-terminal